MQIKVKFELVEGDPRILTIMVNDGWEIVNTFPNPFPQPYFYALMKWDSENYYSIEALRDHLHRGGDISKIYIP